MASITLYEDNNYRGRSVTLTGANPKLGNEGFDDKTSSCKVESGHWILYQNDDFGGNYCILGPGDYADAKGMGFSNDSLSSLRPLPESGVCLFENYEFSGRMVELTAAQSNFGNIDFNDETSSVIVVSGTWDLFQNYDFNGTRWQLSTGRYAKPEEGGFKNDSVSSAQPA